MLWVPPQATALIPFSEKVKSVPGPVILTSSASRILLSSCHALRHSRVVHATGIEEEVFKSFRAHLGLLGHGGSRPAKTHHLVFFTRQSKTGLRIFMAFFMSSCGRSEFSKNIGGSTQGNIGVHCFHSFHFPGKGRLELSVRAPKTHSLPIRLFSRMTKGIAPLLLIARIRASVICSGISKA